MKEQIYNDFITKLLPQIQSGLTITKDYFFDLFGRYIKYLIITDFLGFVISALIVILFIVLGYKIARWIVKTQDEDTIFFSVLVSIPFIVCFIFAVISVYANTLNLIKDYTVPEIRVYEEVHKQITDDIILKERLSR